jgi:hypothetical protein
LIAAVAGLGPQNSNQSAPPLQTAPTPGTINGKPARYLRWSAGSNSPPSVFDAGAPAAPFIAPAYLDSSGGMPGLFAAVATSDPINPMQVRPPQGGGASGTINAKPRQYLGRSDGNNWPATTFEPSAPARMFALPDSRKFTGDILDWIAALAGIGRQNPRQAASSLPDDRQRDFYRQPRFVQGWR